MIIGHEKQRNYLAYQVASGRVSHAFLFGGLVGLGKATVAAEFMQHILCQQGTNLACANCDACRACQNLTHPDFFILKPDEAGRIEIEAVRALRARLFSSALVGQAKVALIDGVDLLSPPAASTLLKILEEPPARTHIVMVAHRPERLLSTIRSRACYFGFTPVSRSILQKYLAETNPDFDSEKQARFLDMADGRPGILVTLQASAEVGEHWVEVTRLAQNFLVISGTKRFQSLEDWPKENLNREGALFFLARLREAVRAKVRDGSRAALGALILLVETERAILYNTSPRLALEWLALHIP